MRLTQAPQAQHAVLPGAYIERHYLIRSIIADHLSFNPVLITQIPRYAFLCEAVNPFPQAPNNRDTSSKCLLRQHPPKLPSRLQAQRPTRSMHQHRPVPEVLHRKPTTRYEPPPSQMKSPTTTPSPSRHHPKILLPKHPSKSSTPPSESHLPNPQSPSNPQKRIRTHRPQKTSRDSRPRTRASTAK